MQDLTRRKFLASTLGTMAAPAIIGCGRKTNRVVTGSFVNESGSMGHKIRDGFKFPESRNRIKKSVVIVGGGISGLSAAWRLNKRGLTDFAVLELEQEVGGTARSGQTEVSKHPWGAHYVPVPNRNSHVERELFTELGLVLPDGSWNQQYICKQPQERLFHLGSWQEGIHPHQGATPQDEEDFRRFNEHIDYFRDTGEFTIQSDKLREMVDLDRMSMEEWMSQNGLNSQLLRWYVDYGCRDDYGARLSNTSAWAGIHYFSCHESTEDEVFTWPEGNGWLVKQLAARVGHYIRPNQMVYRIRKRGTKMEVLTTDAVYEAEAVIFAAPTFLAPYLVEGMEPLEKSVWEYSPWLVANITLEEPPSNGAGEQICWDNVIYHSPSLGYVVAHHQSGWRDSGRMLWTYYFPLADGPAVPQRISLYTSEWGSWKERILADLEQAHSDIRHCVSRIDMMRMGHAMIRPTPGSMTHPQRRRLRDASGSLMFAHTDLSGISIFEEAQFNGVKAADRALAHVS